MAQQQEVFIVQAKRTAVGAFLGTLKNTTPQQMSAALIKDILAQYPTLDPHDIDEVIIGHVLQAGYGQNTARQAAIMGGIPHQVPAMAINKLCGSGMKAVHLAYQRIALGDADIMLAGGHENMSQAPYFLPDARLGKKMGAWNLQDSILRDGLTCALSNDIHMGITAENLAKKFAITRAEQDAFAHASQQKASQASTAGKFKAQITPIIIPNKRGDDSIFNHDEFIKADTSIQQMANLKPAFLQDGTGTVTAANSSGLNDGAAMLLLMSAQKCRALNITPMAKITAIASCGVAPDIMGYGPVPASRQCLQKANLSVDDIDIIEANEAFAAQAISVNKEMGWDTNKVNVNGGAIAIGHPIGASGARILTFLTHEMQARSAKRGLATMCIGGGQGITTIIEQA